MFNTVTILNNIVYLKVAKRVDLTSSHNTRKNFFCVTVFGDGY